jgi:hypothetical protein
MKGLFGFVDSQLISKINVVEYFLFKKNFTIYFSFLFFMYKYCVRMVHFCGSVHD